MLSLSFALLLIKSWISFCEYHSVYFILPDRNEDEIYKRFHLGKMSSQKLSRCWQHFSKPLCRGKKVLCREIKKVSNYSFHKKEQFVISAMKLLLLLRGLRGKRLAMYIICLWLNLWLQKSNRHLHCIMQTILYMTCSNKRNNLIPISSTTQIMDLNNLPDGCDGCIGAKLLHWF